VRECPYDKERFIAFAPRSIGNKPNLKKHLGVFDTAEAAARAYDDAVLRDDEVGLGRHSTVTAVGRGMLAASTANNYLMVCSQVKHRSTSLVVKYLAPATSANFE
jgi:hypothetical protein